MIRTVARGLTATVLAAAVAIASTIQWTGTAFWFALSAALAGVIVGVIAIFVTRWVRAGRKLDAAIAHIHIVNDCDRAGHAYRKLPQPTVWRCANCGDRVESTPGWVGSDAS